MNIDRVKQTLKKVNALVENLDEQGQTSALEMDLLKRYLRDMYEDVMGKATRPEPIESTPQVSTVIETPAEPVARIITAPVEQPKAPEAPAPVEAVKPIEPVAPPKEELQQVIDDQTTYYDADATTEQPAVVSPEKEPTNDINAFKDPVQYFPPEPEIEPEPVLTPQEVSTAPAPGNDATRFVKVFGEVSANDLADKYKMQRIGSIEEAMGINQRMLTINELFDGDHQAFMAALAELNGAGSFDHARQIIIAGPASKFNWDSDNKHKLASDFVVLVRRRFA